ncbi:serine-rich adhesin for platelets-like [Watersipora subatra]|uniref:serine-rich adhesin for platelets-like n=1 Tax=Watersipora subatra TaxID=2589382 RepID=UPI00355B452C
MPKQHHPNESGSNAKQSGSIGVKRTNTNKALHAASKKPTLTTSSKEPAETSKSIKNSTGSDSLPKKPQRKSTDKQNEKSRQSLSANDKTDQFISPSSPNSTAVTQKAKDHKSKNSNIDSSRSAFKFENSDDGSTVNTITKGQKESALSQKHQGISGHSRAASIHKPRRSKSHGRTLDSSSSNEKIGAWASESPQPTSPAADQGNLIENEQKQLQAEVEPNILSLNQATNVSIKKRSSSAQEANHTAGKKRTADNELHAGIQADSSRRRRSGRPSKVESKNETVKVKGKKGGKEKNTNKSSNPSGDESDGTVLQCKHCNFSSPEFSKMKFHFASAHTLLYSKAEPEGSSTTASMKKVFKMLGGKATCPHCNKSIGTPAYYKKHVEWCNSDKTLMEACDLCGGMYTAFWIASHKTYCRKKAEKTSFAKATLSSSENETLSTLNSSGKRDAAKRAMSVIRKLKEGEEVNWNDVFTPPPVTQPSEETLSQWQHSLDESKPFMCQHSGCQVQETTIGQITCHYLTCSFNGLESHTWNCKICSQVFHSESLALEHVKSVHARKSRKRKTLDGADCKTEGALGPCDEDVSRSDSSDESAGDELIDYESDTEKPRSAHGGKDICQYLPVKYRLSRKELCDSLHCVTQLLLPKLMPETLRLKANAASLPSTRSIRFQVEDDSKVHELNAGQTIPHSGGYMTYVGRAIKAASWCPVDRQTGNEVLKGDQYVAVFASDAKCRDMREITVFSDVIEIWRAPGLARKEEVKKLVLNHTLTHNFGYIHQMKWSYNSAFSLRVTGMSRLGLLALAASDGAVHIASVPFLTPSDTASFAQYNINEDLKLEVQGNRAQCTCVDWQRVDNKYILAGFSDGSVGIWYLDPELRGRVLQASRVFRAHTSTLTAIACCPFKDDLFATFSRGWYIWDLKNLTSPYLTPKSTDWCLDLHTKAIWPRVYQIIITCTDPSFGAHSLSMLSLGYDFLIANQKVPIHDVHLMTDVDACDCLDTLVVSSLHGTIAYHTPVVPKHIRADHTIKFISQWSALKTREVEDDLIRFEYLKSQKVNYSGAKGLLCDVKTLELASKKHSINSVSMNPNCGAHGWLAGGVSIDKTYRM